MIITLINNKIIDSKNAKISVLSDAFQRGYGIFETLRTYTNKKTFQLNEYIDRLFDSAGKIDLKMRYSKAEIIKMLEKVIKKSPHKIQRLKIIAIKEGIVITSMPMPIDKKFYLGVKCKTINCLRCIPEVKSISYLSSYLSHERAARLDFYEAILTDKTGEVYEGAYSNIFWFEGETLCTRKDEVLPGITAKVVIKLSPFKVKFKSINIKDLYKKEEIFLTQSTKGILPIIHIDKHKIGNGKAGEKTKKLMELFFAEVEKSKN